ncbi:TPA: hypothetical protein ROX98_000529 [Bacillus pseudomycoides]|nr:hypothetical protein [Bacillus pseudomycoides]
MRFQVWNKSVMCKGEFSLGELNLRPNEGIIGIGTFITVYGERYLVYAVSVRTDGIVKLEVK